MFSQCFEKRLWRFKLSESDFSNGPQAKPSRQPVFVNNVRWGHNHAQGSEYCLWLLSCYKGRTERLRQRLYGLQHLKYLLAGPLQEKLGGVKAEGQSGACAVILQRGDGGLDERGW